MDQEIRMILKNRNEFCEKPYFPKRLTLYFYMPFRITVKYSLQLGAFIVRICKKGNKLKMLVPDYKLIYSTK